MSNVITRQRHGLGWIPDTPKKADFRVRMSKEEMATISLPPSVQLWTPPILDQKSTSGCTGFASSSLYRYMLRILGKPDFQPSPLFNYWFGRHVPRLGWEDEDEGAMPRDVMQSMISNGVVWEQDWPFSEDSDIVNRRPPQTVLATAKKNRIIEGKYVRMLANDNLFHLKYSLTQGLPFLCGIDVYSSFFDTGGNGMIPMPQTNQTFEGGHLGMVSGFDDLTRRFTFVNSWGEEWGRCLAGGTSVQLLNGKQEKIENLVGKLVWVYSVDERTLEIVPTQALGISSGYRDDLVRIVLDNEESVVCTRDHLWMLRDGTFERASKLQTGTSLMPLYRSEKKGYESVYSPRSHKWFVGHWSVARKLGLVDRNGHLETCVSGSCRLVVHHKDFDGLNNEPNNLEVMSACYHKDLHQRLGSFNGSMVMKRLWQEQPERMLAIALKNIGDYNEKARMGLVIPTTKQLEARKRNGERFASLPPHPLTEKQLAALRVNGFRVGSLPKSSEHKARLSESLEKAHQEGRCPLTDKQREARSENMKRVNQLPKGPVTEAQRSARRQNILIATAARVARNHKVVSVEDLGITLPVYDLLVEKENCANFALSTGVFVHNSGLGFMPYEYVANAGLAGDFWRIEAIT